MIGVLKFIFGKRPQKDTDNRRKMIRNPQTGKKTKKG